jgi:hypothetical protein
MSAQTARLILWALIAGVIAATGSAYLAFHPNLWFGAALALSTATGLAWILRPISSFHVLVGATIAGMIAESTSLITNVIALPVQIRLLQKHPVHHLPLPVAFGSATMIHDLMLFNAIRCFVDWGVFIVMVVIIQRILVVLTVRTQHSAPDQ